MFGVWNPLFCNFMKLCRKSKYNIYYVMYMCGYSIAFCVCGVSLLTYCQPSRCSAPLLTGQKVVYARPLLPLSVSYWYYNYTRVSRVWEKLKYYGMNMCLWWLICCYSVPRIWAHWKDVKIEATPTSLTTHGTIFHQNTTIVGCFVVEVTLFSVAAAV